MFFCLKKKKVFSMQGCFESFILGLKQNLSWGPHEFGELGLWFPNWSSFNNFVCVAFLNVFSLRILQLCSYLYEIVSCNVYAEVFFSLQKSVPHPWTLPLPVWCRGFVMCVTSTCAACTWEVWPDVSSGFMCVKTNKVQPVCTCYRLWLSLLDFSTFANV